MQGFYGGFSRFTVVDSVEIWNGLCKRGLLEIKNSKSWLSKTGVPIKPRVHASPPFSKRRGLRDRIKRYSIFRGMAPESCNLFMNSTTTQYTTRYNVSLSLLLSLTLSRARKLSHLLVQGTRLIALKKEKEKKKHVTSRYAESVVIRHESFVRGFRERTNERRNEKKGNFFFFSSSFLSFSFLRSSSIFSLVFSDPNRATRLLITKRRYKYMYIYIFICASVCLFVRVYKYIRATYAHTFACIFVQTH